MGGSEGDGDVSFVEAEGGDREGFLQSLDDERDADGASDEDDGVNFVARAVGLLEDLRGQARARLDVLADEFLECLAIHLVLEVHRAVLGGEIITETSFSLESEAFLSAAARTEEGEIHASRQTYGPPESLVGDLVAVMVKREVEVVAAAPLDPLRLHRDVERLVLAVENREVESPSPEIVYEDVPPDVEARLGVRQCPGDRLFEKHDLREAREASGLFDFLSLQNIELRRTSYDRPLDRLVEMAVLRVALYFFQDFGGGFDGADVSASGERDPRRRKEVALYARDGAPENVVAAGFVGGNILKKILDRLPDEGFVVIGEVDEGGGFRLAFGVEDDLGVAGARVSPGDAGIGGAEVYADGRYVLAHGSQSPARQTTLSPGPRVVAANGFRPSRPRGTSRYYPTPRVEPEAALFGLRGRRGRVASPL